jgi:hypothetical protein
MICTREYWLTELVSEINKLGHSIGEFQLDQLEGYSISTDPVTLAWDLCADLEHSNVLAREAAQDELAFRIESSIEFDQQYFPEFWE